LIQFRDEETGVAATRRAFTAAVPDKRMDSDSDNDEDGFSDGEDQAEEFEVGFCFCLQGLAWLVFLKLWWIHHVNVVDIRHFHLTHFLKLSGRR